MAMSEEMDSKLDENEGLSIMGLPIETRAKIFRMIHQKFIPNVRLVCRQWKLEVDRFYDFRLDVFGDSTDFLNAVYEWRCNECTVWTMKDEPDNRSIFRYPDSVKRLKIYGTLTDCNLQKLISDFKNLEYLTISRRVNSPKILNMRDTPELGKLIKLKHLVLNSGDFHGRLSNSYYGVLDSFNELPMTDCYFPSLTQFEVFKRFPHNHFTMVANCLLKFISKHARTLTNIDINLLPIPTIGIIFYDDISTTRNAYEEQFLDRYHVCVDKINLESLRTIRLEHCCVATPGSKRDTLIWKNVLENQNKLRVLQFEWLYRENLSELRERVAGFPWTFFRLPIIKSSDFLVSVDLVGISMIARTNGGQLDSDSEILPFDMSVFRNCIQLKHVTLRCHENHGRVHFPIPLEAFNDDVDERNHVLLHLDLEELLEINTPEFPLLINGFDLPISIVKLEIDGLCVFTTDLEAIFQKCINLQTLFIKDCGKSGALGVTALLIRDIAKLEKLKFLEICGFNDIIINKKSELRRICHVICSKYDGQDTWLQFDNGNSTAYEELRYLREVKD